MSLAKLLQPRDYPQARKQAVGFPRVPFVYAFCSAVVTCLHLFIEIFVCGVFGLEFLCILSAKKAVAQSSEDCAQRGYPLVPDTGPDLELSHGPCWIRKIDHSVPQSRIELVPRLIVIL